MLRGYAWAPQSGIRRVEVRVNGGRWFDARIIDPQINRYTWVRFEFPVNPKGGDVLIKTRATDNAGNTQPADVPFNKGGYNFSAVPKFRLRFA